MYKIFIHNRPFILTATEGVAQFEDDGKKYQVFPHLGKRKHIAAFIDKFEKNLHIHQIVLHHHDLTALWEDFCSFYNIIEAAGGLVTNEDLFKGKVLTMFRRGSWDLPKGKIDQGETPEIAAVREVEEETGVKNIQLGKKLGDTYHTYAQKGKRILKKTYWYAMTTPHNELTPQIEEDIERLEWVHLPLFLPTKPIIYNNILEVFEMAKTM
jgi:8-oxo-dGTP pyrophosphatase MutT (NUDIX family)